MRHDKVSLIDNVILCPASAGLNLLEGVTRMLIRSSFIKEVLTPAAMVSEGFVRAKSPSGLKLLVRIRRFEDFVQQRNDEVFR